MVNRSPASRRYLKRFMPTMIAYVVLLFLAVWILKHLHPTGVALVLVAILPALPILGVIGVLGLYIIEERDEYVRQRIVTSMLIGLAVTLGAATIWGFLEQARAVIHLPAYFAFALWCASWGLAQGALALRDRMGGTA